MPQGAIAKPRPIRGATGLWSGSPRAGACVFASHPRFTLRERFLLALNKTPVLPPVTRVVSGRGGVKGPAEMVSALSGLSPPGVLNPAIWGQPCAGPLCLSWGVTNVHYPD